MKKEKTMTFLKIRLWHKSVLCLLAGLLLSVSSYAQQRTITGTVTDKSGEPIPSVTVMVKGTSTGTITNFDGQYSLSGDIPADGVLTFSFIGMKTKDVSIGNRATIDVTMEENVTGLDEVVVVGYGTQQKKDVTGSVAMVDSKQMDSRPNTQMGALIEGKAAGVQVLSSSGKPSQGFSIRIRGTNSITAGSEPLYVVDGVPTTDTRSINPADIQSISILKDASSAAIYGAQGANGVVLITTYKGTTDRPTVKLDVYNGFSQVWRTLPVLNGEQYRDLMTEMGKNTDWSLYTHNTDWQKEIFQNGRSQNYQLSVSGKSNKTSYYMSGGWVEQVGAVRSAQMNRYNFKINLDQEVNKWLTVGTRMAYSVYSDVDVNDNQGVDKGGVLLGALTTPPVIGIYNPDGTFTSNPFQNWENPIASTDGSNRKYKSQRILGNVYAKIDFLKDFSFKTNLGIDDRNEIYDYFLDPFLTSYGRALNGQGINNTNKTSYYIWDNTLTFNKTLGSHKIEALAGSVIQEFYWENAHIETRNFSGNGVQTTNGGSEMIAASSDKAKKRNTSFLGRINYSFKDKYLLTVNFRADASSVFGPDNRWGYFPSSSIGWRISQEPFMQDLSFLDDLKLRAGWGVVGNDQITNYAWFGRVGSGANYPIGGSTLPGTYPSSVENRNLKWEQSEQTNVGLDLSVFRGRIRFSADAYIRNTSDLLLNAPLPRSTGFDSAIQNVGKLQNKGLEFNLTTVNVKKAINWSTNFNISFNRNKVVDLVGQEIFAGGITNRGDASLVKEGLPLGTLFGYVWGGVDPQTGNAYYIAKDGSSTFTPSADDRVVIGDANPKFIYGMTNNVSYKSLSLSVFLQGSQGNDMLNASRMEIEGMTGPQNQSTAVLRRWRQPGDQTDIPKASWGSYDNSRISSRFIEDGSYLRLKTVTLSYQLPKAWTDKVKMQNVKVYATGENLWTLTDYSGFDPEVNAFGTSNTAKGIDYGTYPQTRNIIFGLNITF
ncbi:TonB-dependent receptor [Prolixibacter sp. NT017]|uniref:SusC/RagA family TonB-linked outer membrane protein n=1 Tax=Prolixibacter sp. NT017 TaxID=2652390 RepID=UPI0012884B8C|nr:TonB-dependent receptor [Prolixibacter sp. NT017]GET24073.1 SusC/RagA family TonB-linked outer membrane protein [Prolixibacter sp. NT017]